MIPLQTDESGAIELKTGGVRHDIPTLTEIAVHVGRNREDHEKTSILICRPASSRISVCRPALKCIVNRWVEPVVMVKPVPVFFYLAQKISICVIWGTPIRKFASSCSVQLM